MKLFHGSNVSIETVDLSKSKRYKDFGQAFYLSAEEEQALKMAEAKVIQFGGEAIVSEFEFNAECLSSNELNAKLFDSYTREWAEFVFNNRDENQQFQHDYDVFTGLLPMII